MKTVIILGVILIAIVVIFMIRKSGKTTEGIKTINSKEAHTLVDESRDKVDFVILDVRTPSEFASGHIPGAINIDYHSSGFSKALDTLQKEKTYLVYCRSGHRSSAAAGIMKEKQFRNIYNLQGGINGWNQH